MRVQGFYAFGCKACGMFGVREIRRKFLTARYTCKFCRASMGIKSKRSFGIALKFKGPFDCARLAGAVARRLNGQDKIPKTF